MGNAYLEAFTKEKVCIVAGPKFGPLKCRDLIIVKLLHGLRTSSLSWNERIANCLQEMRFEPHKMEPDTWFLPRGEDHYEYITFCVDNLIITYKDPKNITDLLINKHSF